MKVRLLRNLRINEVSAVDRGAGEGVKIVLMKRDDEPPPDARSKGPLEKWERAQRREAERREFEDREKLIKGRERGAELFKHYLAKAEVMADRDASEDPRRHAPVVEHHASKVADLLVEAGSFPTREQALAHLLHHKDGAALLRRLNKQEDFSMKTTDSWQKIAADHGVVSVAKHIVEHGAGSLDEHAFTALVTSHAQRAHPGLSPAQAFEKLFTAQTEESKWLRLACAACKAWPAPLSIEPTMEGGADAFPTVTRRPGSSPARQPGTEDGLGNAYEKLTALAEQQRRDGETAAQAFARIYSDPAYKHLAEAERAENRPAYGVRVVG